MIGYERIDARPEFDGEIRRSHELRYHFAAGFIGPGDRILDAGCGTGYGRAILTAHGNPYLGIDRDPPAGHSFLAIDFETDDWTPADLAYFDVFVGLEIVEHLSDPAVDRFLDLAAQAHRWIILSTPIVPNSNPFHRQQFGPEDLPQRMTDRGRALYGMLMQAGTYGLYVFEGRG